MSQEHVEKILGRLITDDDFREAAKSSLLGICTRNGYVLTYDEWRVLENLDCDLFIPLSEYLDKELKRCGKEELMHSVT